MSEGWRELVMETERLLLRPWRENDAEALYRCASDPAVGPAAGWKPHESAEESREIIRTVLAAEETYALVLRESGEPVGSIGTFPSRAQGALPGEQEIGYWIARPLWGQGLMPEALERILRRCFEEQGAERVWGGHFAENDRSRRVQEKCGFRFHHRENAAFPRWDGVMMDECFNLLERGDWEKRER